MTARMWHIQALTAKHTRSLAECHIACWRGAYRELVPAHLLDAFDVDQRADRWDRTRIAFPGSIQVALVDDVVIGFSSAGASQDKPPVTEIQLNALYVREPWYGTGVADELLDAAVDPAAPCSLWVFEENPRAQAFYRKHGFVPDGARKVEEFSRTLIIRMVRGLDVDLPHRDLSG